MKVGLDNGFYQLFSSAENIGFYQSLPCASNTISKQPNWKTGDGNS